MEQLNGVPVYLRADHPVEEDAVGGVPVGSDGEDIAPPVSHEVSPGKGIPKGDEYFLPPVE
jgi:hypothetical protein